MADKAKRDSGTTTKSNGTANVLLHEELALDDLNAPPLQIAVDHEEEVQADQISERRPKPTQTVVIKERPAHVRLSLVTFSILGVLTRLGLVALWTSGGQAIFALITAQFVGCVVIGFATARRTEIMMVSFPLLIGISTGFSGSVTTFSAWMLSLFNALANTSDAPHGAGGNFLEAVSLFVVTLAVSLGGITIGEHLADFLMPPIEPPIDIMMVKAPSLAFRSIVDTLLCISAVIFVGLAIFLTIYKPQWQSTTFSCLFGPFGTLLRYFFSIHLNNKRPLRIIPPNFPLGTLTANLLGTLLDSIFFILQKGGGGLSPAADTVSYRVLQAMQDGFCGCLTTVSTFAIELTFAFSTDPYRRRRRRKAWGYALISIGPGILLCVLIVGSFTWSKGLVNV